MEEYNRVWSSRETRNSVLLEAEVKLERSRGEI